VQYKQHALTWQRSKFIVALKINQEGGWVFHVQCAVARQKESPKNPEFICSRTPCCRISYKLFPSLCMLTSSKNTITRESNETNITLFNARDTLRDQYQ